MAKQKVEKVEETSVAQVTERKVRKTIDKDVFIDVMNITKGGLTYKDRYGVEYRWEEEFAVVGVPFGELQTILSSRSAFLKAPWMFILDEEAIDALNLKSLYESLIDPRDVDNFLRLGEVKIRERLEKSPASIQAMVIRNARNQVEQLTVGRQRMIEQATGAQLVVD